jgi:ABC-type Mn2+/Zn2+ transport system permease subunit
MANDAQDGCTHGEDIPLIRAAEFLLDECRMVLPGIQALFGFQLIAVFNPTFSQVLGPDERLLHLLAIVLVTVAIALIMTPAAYHRQTGPQQITEAFIRLSTRLMLWSMLPLCVSICLDLYLIAKIIVDDVLAPLLAATIFMVFFVLWFVLPRAEALRGAVSKPQ